MIFLIRRLGLAVLQMFGVSVLAFALLEIAPGDYLDDVKVNPQISPEAVERWRHEFGLGQSVVIRYLRWSSSVLRGEFGHSMAYGMPVSQLLGNRVRNTLYLSMCALSICWLAAVPLGVLCGARRGGWIDRLTGSAASMLLALPDLLAGVLVLGLAVQWGIGPVSGRLLPAALVLACLSFPGVFRHTRSSIRQTLAMPFIDHLRACGVAEARILFVHALRAAANPIISLFGLSFAALTSMSLVIEVTLSWPGLGPLLLEAILARDVAVVLAAVMLSATLLLLGNLAADLMLFASDPRIRTESR